MKFSHYCLLADLFEYPKPGYVEGLQVVQSFLHKNYPETSDNIDTFLDLLPVDDFYAMEELFTRSFDVQAITTLDIGYVLFGDDYKRGELLANLNKEHLKVENDCFSELADHLPNVLRLISKMEDEELVEEMADQLIGPAVKKMISEFDPDRLNKKQTFYKKHYKTLIASSKEWATLYANALKAVYQVLYRDFGLTETSAIKPCSDFLQSVACEIKIEGGCS